MRAYADTSFLIKLLAREDSSEAAVAAYRRLGLPRLFLVDLHGLEVENAVRQRAFHQRRTVPRAEQARVTREQAAILARYARARQKGMLIEVAVDWQEAFRQALRLSAKHTTATGSRSLDLLHIACALELEAEVFLTTDLCQSRMATAEGFQVVTVEDP